jgi:hypothetical protein
MQAGVYGIRCVPTDEIYVGSGINWEKRTRQHLARLRAGTSRHRFLQACWTKYGEAAFEVVLLEAFDDHEKMWAAEGRFIAAFKGKLLNSLSGAFANCYIHGMSGTRTFKSWDSMLGRCKPNVRGYEHVTVCDRWRESFLNFLADMGERPESTTLDRYPNKYGNYEPTNCRWATPGQQQRNIRKNLYLTVDGVTKLLVDWADEKGIPRDLLRRRYHAGMIGGELFAPSYSRYAGDGRLAKRRRIETRDIRKITAHGKTLSVSEWANELGLTTNCIKLRIDRYGMSPEIALVATAFKRGPGFRATPK